MNIISKLFVLVAIPEIWDKKFNATLSAINIELALPFIMAINEFFLTVEPKREMEFPEKAA